MSTTLDDVILEKISFLREQLGAEDDPAFIRTFQAQIRILQNAQIDRLDELIAIRRKDLDAYKSAIEADTVFAELDALEWLQRQAMFMS
ncbi:MAG TPA: hypothetical protein VJP79_05005 [Nitrososphaera sp.]|jgi:hypothetical protein|nr:hypothetical protein [Nitrososphaera sp.]